MNVIATVKKKIGVKSDFGLFQMVLRLKRYCNLLRPKRKIVWDPDIKV